MGGSVEACAAAGPPHPAKVAINGFEPEHRQKAVWKLLEAGRECGAVFCINDQSPSGAIGTAGSFGLDGSRDLADTRRDDIPIAAHLVPPLTTVRQLMHELASDLPRCSLSGSRAQRFPACPADRPDTRQTWRVRS
jgi:DNA-binding LacI/PurR family transcriptional regulator